MRNKLLLTVLLTAFIVLASNITDNVSYAAAFDLTPTKTSSKWTNEVLKSGSNYENCFYVTPTYFSTTGSVSAISQNVNNPSIYSHTVTLSSGGANVARSAYYVNNAPANQPYKMKLTFGSASVGSKINVKGRYTP